jgi:hypothetical protein
VFALGFLVRPVGGWLLGRYADRRASTCPVGCIPSDTSLLGGLPGVLMQRRIVGLIVFLAAAGCSRAAAPAATPEPAPTPATSPSSGPFPGAPAAGTEQEFHGAYSRGFEASWFSPCDAPSDDALWWVTLSEDARVQRDSLLKALTEPPTGALAVRWRGTISARMPAGQMGRGTRYLLVTRILEVRPLSTLGACAPLFRSS